LFMNYQKKVLENGMRIVVVPVPGAPSLTVAAMVEAGSKYESRKENGISHFLEHMFFKGTKNRPTTLAITKEFDGLGAENNASTSQESTYYYAKSHPKHFDQMLDVISDIYQNSSLPGAEIEKEKGVVIEEMNMYKDLPQEIVGEIFQELLYGDTPAGREILGTEENVKSFTRENISDYMQKHYVASATTVVVAGDISPATAFEKVTKAFENIKIGEKIEKEKVIEKQAEPRVKLKFKETDQSHIIIGVRAFDMYNPRSRTLNLLGVVLGQGMSSRLFQKMREELGICYYIGAGARKLTDHGFFAISAGVDKKRIEEAVKEILKEMKKIRDEEVGEEELRKAKDYMLGHLYLGLESSDSLAEFYGFQELFKKEIKTPKDIEEEVEKITAQDLQKVARDIMRNEGLNMAVVGNYGEKDLENFIKILTL